jgi:hypothetical protein
VVLYEPDRFGHTLRHERATHEAIARRLAVLKGYDYVGEYDPVARYSVPIYVVPGETLVGVAAALAVGIRGENDLFGGVVPHAFVATKAITHPLAGPEARAPAGWSHGFGRRVRDRVLFGFTAFSAEDARRAGAILLARGPIRLKPTRATGGLGQEVISDIVALEAALDIMDMDEVSSHGLVLEEDLSEVTTYSVGRVCAADLVITYCGTQRLTADNAGEAVYGGSDLVVARGEFDALLGLDTTDEARAAVEQARAYDAAAQDCFPGLLASRRNYDVALGVDNAGRRRGGVLEQSWRIGGASGAEIAALEAFRADPGLRTVRSSTVEVYGARAAPPPPRALVYFSGVDEKVGPISKYATLELYDGDT